MEETTVVALRRRYSAEVWRERIADCRTSGQTVTAWCEANAINSKSYYRWERKLLAESGQPQVVVPYAQNRFTEIASTNGKSCFSIAILHGAGITCEISNDIAPELLSTILAAMADHA